MPMAPDGEFDPQAVVRIAEVVQGAHQEHHAGERLLLLGQGAGAACEPGEALPEGGVQALDERRVDVAASLGALE